MKFNFLLNEQNNSSVGRETETKGLRGKKKTVHETLIE